MNHPQNEDGGKVALSLDGTLAGILRVLVNANPQEVGIVMGKAAWLYENIPLETLRAELLMDHSGIQ